MKKHYSKLKAFSFLILLLASSSLIAQTYNDADDLADAVNDATNGGTFIVANGSYNDFEVSFEKVATEENPIIVKAETVGGVTLTGESAFRLKKSAFITIEGFVIDANGDNTLVKLEGCNNIRISRNVFELATTESIKWVYIGGVWDDKTYPFTYPSHHNRIDHNIFQNKNTPGHYITVDGSTDESTDVAYQSQYDRIDHNYFKNNSPRAVNEQESIRVGWSEMSASSGFTTVEFNLFEECDGDPEIVSIKSSDNIIRHNTFLKSYGTLSLRHGNRNRVEGNYFFGGDKAIGTSPDGATLYTGGIRIYGKDHVIINNYMQGLNGTKWDAPITLTLGDAEEGNSNLTKHFRADNVLIAYNTLVDNSHGIEIGFDNNGSYSKDLKDVTIANNLITGSENSLVAIIDGNDQGNNITWESNLFNPTGTATTIADATTTSFTASMVKEENPYIVSESYNDYTIWKTTDSSPTYLSGVNSENIDFDIEGQSRPILSNPGADHFSTESKRYMPLKPTNVGPNAYETDENLESLYLSTISNFDAIEGTQTITVTANVDWSTSTDSSWITISPVSGSNNGSFDVTVSANTEYTERTGKVTITGGDLTRFLNITQSAADPKSNLTLINDASENDHVVVNYVFAEEIDADKDKNNIAEHSLDKDFDTQWSGEGVPGEIIYDLGGTFDLQLVDFAATNGKTYEFQIWVSKTGTDAADFINAYATNDNLVSNSDGTFKGFMFPTVATDTKYVKIVGYGQPARPSNWNTITEIEFYKTKTLAVNNTDLADEITLYPNPTNSQLNIKISKRNISQVQIFSVNGKKVFETKIDTQKSEINMDVSKLAKGAYFVLISDNNNSKTSKTVIIK
ncbi:Por secretion system C-terminal sorting domain-containing protein [Polaribacter sp. KT25b]|uniref:chondroitinase-B domain-containing protein n=1 Tax=Polaribacter sp. KT25b TaxID=1855336 RepID=UPI00087A35EA|nr:chondroitinase-B domain-containing protein [Polaribacter sp. KT25b]SDS28918.1 Por secretion system C-terminal sorting domain-containing protein [Polaribacter sp. KT25b]